MDIFKATESGILEEVKRFLEEGIDVNIQNNVDWTPLLHACRNDQFDVAYFLLENGADIERYGCCDFTPLMAASCIGSFKITKLLLKRGANVNIETITGATALDYAENEQNLLLLFHRYSHLLNEDEKKFLQSRKYRLSFGSIIS